MFLFSFRIRDRSLPYSINSLCLWPFLVKHSVIVAWISKVRCWGGLESGRKTVKKRERFQVEILHWTEAHCVFLWLTVTLHKTRFSEVSISTAYLLRKTSSNRVVFLLYLYVTLWIKEKRFKWIHGFVHIIQQLMLYKLNQCSYAVCQVCNLILM